MVQEDLIYIIIVNWNGYQDTLNCVQSLHKLHYNQYKIILVDNASSEPIDSILDVYPDIILIKNNENLGFAGANNKGIQYALDHGAAYVWLLNNDTIVKEDSLSLMVDCIKQDDSIGIVCPKIYFWSEPDTLWYGGGKISWPRGTTLHLGIMEKSSPLDKEDYPSVDFATGCSMLIRRKVFADVGLMSEDYFLYFEDTDFCCQTIKHGYKIIYDKNSVIWHKVSASTSKNSLKEYYFTRNNLYFMVEHAPKKYYPLFMLFFLKRNIRYLAWLLLKKKNTVENRKAKAFYKGIGDFLKNKKGPL